MDALSRARAERDIWKVAFLDLVSRVRQIESAAHTTAGNAKQDAQAEIARLRGD